jgi:hypothetical protein
MTVQDDLGGRKSLAAGDFRPPETFVPISDKLSVSGTMGWRADPIGAALDRHVDQ